MPLVVSALIPAAFVPMDSRASARRAAAERPLRCRAGWARRHRLTPPQGALRGPLSPASIPGRVDHPRPLPPLLRRCGGLSGPGS